LILHKLELEPFVLANKSGNGMTIIEALENEIVSDATEKCKFGIVLLTPDDMGYAKKDGETKAEPRARQNVVLEMGMLISSLKRSNVAILKKGHLEVPSDANGIIYLSFNDHVKEVVPRLVERLQNAGIVVSAKAVANASS
jgi:predicted nucleotide-binding protein